jgi:hypothetical protein
MKVSALTFGSITIDGETFMTDVRIKIRSLRKEKWRIEKIPQQVQAYSAFDRREYSIEL